MVLKIRYTNTNPLIVIAQYPVVSKVFSPESFMQAFHVCSVK